LFSEIYYGFSNKELESCKTLDELQKTYTSFSKNEQTATVKVKDEMKIKLTPKTV